MNVNATFSDRPLDIDITNDRYNVDLGKNVVKEWIMPPQLPNGGQPGDILTKHSEEDYDVEWSTPADHAESDNTRPITSAGVYREIGNINALLATI